MSASEAWAQAIEAIVCTALIVTLLLGMIGALPWQNRKGKGR